MGDVNLLIKNGVDVNQSLELFGDMATYDDTIGEFLIGAGEKLPKLKYYKDRKDMANYAIIVHSLKSDAKYFGFTKLAELSYEHEMKSKANDFYYVYEHFDELMAEADRIVHLVKQYMGKEETPNEATNQVFDIKIDNNVNVEEFSFGEIYTEKTILVVDDSNIVRNFAKRIFEGQYKVGTAKDGKEAIDLIKANKDNDNIVCILLDLNMPNVDGFAVLDFMKNNNLFVKFPVSIISGDSSKSTIDRAFTYHIVDMLGKPFTEQDVKRVLEKTIYFKEMND